MTFKETAKTILKYQGIIGLIKHFSPITIFNGQILFMRGYWYNGHFMMRSFNKVKK